MEQARALLLTTKLPLKQVAIQTGYENTGFFYRLFQRMNGISPAEYRRGQACSAKHPEPFNAISITKVVNTKCQTSLK